MTSEGLVTAREGITLEEAKKILASARKEKLPIVDGEGNLKGLITIKDIEKAIKYPLAAKDEQGRLLCAAAVGVTANILDRVAALVKSHVDAVVIDTAHGHSLVMDSLIFFVKSVSNFKSRFVIMPTNFLPSVIGTPEMRYFPISSSASFIVCSGVRENGSVITPFSERFTLSTSSACASIDIFLWITPIPPCLAIAIAMRCSVTVSIPALISGIFSLIFFVRQVDKSTSFGITSEYAGTSSTSSKVMPSPIICPIL